jgi:predicted Zn-dependent protease
MPEQELKRLMRPFFLPNRQRTGWEAHPGRRPAGGRLSRLTAAFTAAAVFVSASASAASAASIVRDAETEALIKTYLAPIFKAAGINSRDPHVFLIPSQQFNAFVANGSEIFVNVGAIIDSETPGELIGVMAHETAHVANGDLARFKQQLQTAKSAALLASLIGLGAVAAGAAAGVSGIGQAGAGVITGVGAVTQGSLLSYRRSQEAEADRSAIRYLEKSGQSGAGMLRTLERLADQTLFLARNVNPYLQSHPLPRERISSVKEKVTRSQYYNRPDPQDLVRRHRMVQAKLVGFTWKPERVNRRYPRADNSLEARYARAISAYQHGPLSPALKQIDGLISAEPNNPYFWELKGQALLERGNPESALGPLRKAVSLAPNSGLIRILLGQALIASGSPANLNEAVKNLTIGLQAEPDVPVGHRALARAYALQNNIPMADLATAQGYFADGQIEDARRHAVRAQAKLKPNSPAWLRADDIVTYKKPRLR